MTAEEETAATSDKLSGWRWVKRVDWVKTVERSFSLLANAAVVTGIGFALYQLHQSNTFEKRRIGIEAVSQTKSAEFLKAYRMLKSAEETRQVADEEKIALVDSLNHVMNVYDNIATLYINDLADKCIIKNGVYSGAKEMAPISDSLSYPAKYRKHFDFFLGLMEQESCEDKLEIPQTSK